MDIIFRKLQGAGNDFIVMKYEDFPDEELFSKLATEVCHRHFGIGADGLMIVKGSEKADFFMYYYNSDGSRAHMCGNGIRCFAKYVYDAGMIKEKFFRIETLAGIKEVEMGDENNREQLVRVNMDKMIFEPKDIPVICDQNKCINQQLIVDGETLNYSTVLMGVPHTVIFLDELKEEHIKKIGPVIEKHNQFPDNTNVNFAKIINRSKIEVKTWERGAGYTLACGTGVTSVCGVAYELGYVNNSVEVITDGGRLTINIEENKDIYMEGSAKVICEGIYYSNLAK
ncbi:diaminopimelate epimerase [Serpentinicella sp. ANB-PHB4]|uniref:diaminopimelate epimerase n=1 Tax=Serpentinicella sp. ANB-PHB4 TaxID=3074076 RepID=UPI002856C3AE|nr:diaminopimelate epimerase [Serpentinicella sp. ANB-PHB4]MDR5658331.1 diaminopimelate epimerase [Serpentinicella sp. ANB-PHB4]